MTKQWPAFVTKDLHPDDSIEMMRRWTVYKREMDALIARGGIHQDDDGWWVETATGELVGPDPEIERPDTDGKSPGKPLKEVLPELHETFRRSRGRPPVDKPKLPVTLRVHPDTLAKFKAKGKNWRSEMSKSLDDAVK